MRFKLLSLMLLSSLSFAQTAPTAGPSLKATMDQISSVVKTLTANLNDPSKNADSAKLADQLVTLFTTAQGQTPTSVGKLADDQKATAVQGFQSLIQKEIDDAKALKSAFDSNNNTQAGTILQDMNTLKSQGHSTYR